MSSSVALNVLVCHSADANSAAEGRSEGATALRGEHLDVVICGPERAGVSLSRCELRSRGSV